MQSDQSSTTWFVQTPKGERGPFSAGQLMKLAASGQLTPGHLVRRGDGAAWISACQVPGLQFVAKPEQAGVSIAASRGAPPNSASPHAPYAITAVASTATQSASKDGASRKRKSILVTGAAAVLVTVVAIAWAGSRFLLDDQTASSNSAKEANNVAHLGNVQERQVAEGSQLGGNVDLHTFIQAIRSSMEKMPRYDEGTRLCECGTQSWDNAKPVPYLMTSGRLIVLNGSSTITFVFPLTAEGRVAFTSAIESAPFTGYERQQICDFSYSHLEKDRQVGRFKLKLRQSRDGYRPFLRSHALPFSWVRLDVDVIGAPQDQTQHLYWVSAMQKPDSDPRYGQVIAELRRLVGNPSEEELFGVMSASDIAGISPSHATEIFQRAAADARRNGLNPRLSVQAGLSGIFAHAALAGVSLEEWRKSGGL